MSTPHPDTDSGAQLALIRLSRSCSNVCGWFRNAARQIDHSARKALLLDIANTLERFHQDLEKERERLGGDGKDHTGLRDALGQIASGLVTQFARGNDAVALRASEKAADELDKQFGKMLDAHLDPGSRELLAKQRRELEEQMVHVHAAVSDAELDQR